MKKPISMNVQSRIKRLGSYPLVEAVASHMDLNLSDDKDVKTFVKGMRDMTSGGAAVYNVATPWGQSNTAVFFEENRELIIEELLIWADEQCLPIMRAVAELPWPKYQDDFTIGAVIYNGKPKDGARAKQTKEALAWLILKRVAVVITALADSRKYSDKLLNDKGKAYVIGAWVMHTNSYISQYKRNQDIERLLKIMEKPLEVTVDHKGGFCYHIFKERDPRSPAVIHLSENHFAD